MTAAEHATFGDLLRRFRKAAALTQEELAERAGLSRRGINDLERGARLTPRKDTVTLLADALELAGDERTAFLAAARQQASLSGPEPATASASAIGDAPVSGDPHSIEQIGQPADAARPVIQAFLIADVRGYTRFTQEHGDEAAARLAARFARLARETTSTHGGQLLELRGDEALVVFPSARQALRAAVALQAHFAEATQADSALPLLVGIGLDAGEPVPVEDGYRGAALNLAARLCAIAGPGEVLASAEIVHLAGKLERLTYSARGSTTLKGFAEPVEVVRITAEEWPEPDVSSRGISDGTPANASSPAAPANVGLAVRRKQNPFTFGRPISDPSRFVGRDREITQVFSRLRNVAFESSSLVGERRMGKTSLLNYLAHPDVRRAQGLDPDKYLFIYVDLQLVDKDMGPQRLWQRLLRHIAISCHHRDVQRALETAARTEALDTFVLADTFDILDAHGQYVVLLLDEFENVTANERFGPDFYYALRSLAIHHHLALVTSSRHGLIELCHSDTIRSSPFFNIFANINLELFSEADARHLIADYLAGTDMEFTDPELARIFHLAGYHPYFLQMACCCLFDAYARHLNADERLAYLSTAYREQATPQLGDYWRHSNAQEQIVLTTLALLEAQGPEGQGGGLPCSARHLQDLYVHAGQTLPHLVERGLIASEPQGYSMVNGWQGAWILHELTDMAHDHEPYGEWHRAHRGTVDRLPAGAKKDAGEILSRVSGRYRDLIVNWLSDPRSLGAVQMLKATLGAPQRDARRE